MAAVATKGVKMEYDQSLLQKMIKNKLDYCFIMYDDIADEFITKFTESSQETSYCYIDEHSAAIVEIQTNRIIGVSFLDYEKNLENEPKKLKQWLSIKYDITRKYRRISLQKEVSSPAYLWIEHTSRKQLEQVHCYN